MTSQETCNTFGVAEPDLTAHRARAGSAPAWKSTRAVIAAGAAAAATLSLGTA